MIKGKQNNGFLFIYPKSVRGILILHSVSAPGHWQLDRWTIKDWSEYRMQDNVVGCEWIRRATLKQEPLRRSKIDL